MEKIELEYMDLYEILSELIYNDRLENPRNLHDFCLNRFQKYQPERLSPEDAIDGVCDSPNTANK